MEANYQNITNVQYIDTNSGKFLLKSKAGNVVKEITTKGIIKHVTANIDKTFLSNVAVQTNIYNDYVCKIINNNDALTIIMAKSHISKIMSNVELLMKMYESVKYYSEHNLDDELVNVASMNNRKKIKNHVNKFAYLLLGHLLKLIESLYRQIKNNTDKNDLKAMLLKYSVFCVFNMNNYVKFAINDKNTNVENIKSDINRITDVKNKINLKIDNLSSSLKSQNLKIDKICNKLEEIQISEMSATSATSINSASIPVISTKSSSFKNDELEKITESVNSANSETSKTSKYSAELLKSSKSDKSKTSDVSSEVSDASSINYNNIKLVGGNIEDLASATNDTDDTDNTHSTTASESGLSSYDENDFGFTSDNNESNTHTNTDDIIKYLTSEK